MYPKFPIGSLVYFVVTPQCVARGKVEKVTATSSTAGVWDLAYTVEGFSDQIPEARLSHYADTAFASLDTPTV